MAWLSNAPFAVDCFFSHFCIHFPDTVEDEKFEQAPEFPYENHLDDAVELISNELLVYSVSFLSKRRRQIEKACASLLLSTVTAAEIVDHFEEKHVKKTKREPTAKFRQYLCDICGKTYTQSSHLWQHLRFHKGVKPFACKEPACARKFTIRPDLNDHIRKCHTGERPYHCLYGSVFYQHRLIHRGERRYGCDECDKRFYRADALKNHLRIHTGEKPYGCLFCTKYFRQRSDRDKHTRARHSSLDANASLLMQIRKMQLEASARAANNKNSATPAEEVLMLGNIAFPKSMFNPLLADIDAPGNASE